MYNVNSFLPGLGLIPPSLQHRPPDCCQMLRIFSCSQPVLHFQIPKGEGLEIQFSIPRAILFHCHSALSFLQHCAQLKALSKAILTPDSPPPEDNNCSPLGVPQANFSPSKIQYFKTFIFTNRFRLHYPNSCQWRLSMDVHVIDRYFQITDTINLHTHILSN